MLFYFLAFFLIHFTSFLYFPVCRRALLVARFRLFSTYSVAFILLAYYTHPHSIIISMNFHCSFHFSHSSKWVETQACRSFAHNQDNKTKQKHNNKNIKKSTHHCRTKHTVRSFRSHILSIRLNSFWLYIVALHYYVYTIQTIAHITSA